MALPYGRRCRAMSRPDPRHTPGIFFACISPLAAQAYRLRTSCSVFRGLRPSGLPPAKLRRPSGASEDGTIFVIDISRVLSFYRASFTSWRFLMKKQILTAISALFLCLGFVGNAMAGDGRCYSNSDCGGGVACNSGKCANAADSRCYSNSDCGKAACNSGKCANAPDGRCYSNSDCGGGSCNSGKCSSAGGRCYSNSDCGNGVSCISGKCANAADSRCYSNSDCGKAACNSGKCANAPDGRCYSDSDCGGSRCNSGKCAN